MYCQGPGISGDAAKVLGPGTAHTFNRRSADLKDLIPDSNRQDKESKVSGPRDCLLYIQPL